MNFIQKIKARFFIKRREEADLNRESANAGAYYVAKVCPDLPFVEKQQAVNHVASGFFMGFRKHEEMMGLNRTEKE